jgi:hypothetical protein
MPAPFQALFLKTQGRKKDLSVSYHILDFHLYVTTYRVQKLEKKKVLVNGQNLESQKVD